VKTVVSYVSILGRSFEKVEDALADEDRLPGIIATYRRSLLKLQRGETHAGVSGPHPLEDIEAFAHAVADYEAKWAEVQEQRKGNKP
jgi:hypothetical protein